MRTSRFFIDIPLASRQQFNLPPALINYIVNVLRLKSGNEIILFNGLGGEYTATLSEVQKRSVSVIINNFIEKNSESPVKIHLFQGISRSERMDFSIQKAVEIGVHSITPVLTQRSNAGHFNSKRLAKKEQHWQGIAQSACEQSGRTTLVKVNSPIRVEQISHYSADIQLLLSPDAGTSLSELKHLKPDSINIFIGPEGGLNDSEIQLSIKNNYQKVTLGPRILRTETAGISTLSVLQYMWGDLA
ncbi:MAG: 16S rRNA (uracil(1498)-N(3))-methyltransferase [gamma proteobacterium symbiont of Taylorina sp.]|nr:16S rRNA (uracil(1498)-N(3))-methyltransferase [gamma proteobacterium symbiont of Taylorina sp.]